MSADFRKIGNRPAARHLKTSYVGIGVRALVINYRRRLAVQTGLNANAKSSIAVRPDRDVSRDRNRPDMHCGEH